MGPCISAGSPLAHLQLSSPQVTFFDDGSVVPAIGLVDGLGSLGQFVGVN